MTSAMSRRRTRGPEGMLKQRLAEAEAARDKALDKVVALNRAHRAALDEATEEKAVLVLRVQELEADAAAASATYDALISLALEIELRNSSLLAQAESARKAAESSAAERIDELGVKISALELQLAESKQTVLALRGEMGSQNEAVWELRAVADKARAAAEEAGADADARTTKAQRTIDALSTANSRLRAELRDARGALQQAETRITELARLETHVANIKADHAVELEKIRQQAEWEVRAAKSANDRCIALTMERDALLGKLSAEQAKVESYRTNASVVKLQRAEAAAARLQSALADLRSENSAMHLKVRALQRKLATAADRSDDLQRKLANKQAELDVYVGKKTMIPGGARQSPGRPGSPAVAGTPGPSASLPSGSTSLGLTTPAQDVSTVPGHVEAYKTKLRERDATILELREKVRALMGKDHARRVAAKSFELERAAYLKEIGQLRRQAGELSASWAGGASAAHGSSASSSLYMEPQSEATVMQLRARNRMLEAQVAELHNVKAMMANTSAAYTRLLAIVESLGVNKLALEQVKNYVASGDAADLSGALLRSGARFDAPRAAASLFSTSPAPEVQRQRLNASLADEPRSSPASPITPLTTLHARYVDVDGASPQLMSSAASPSRPRSSLGLHSDSPLPYRPGSVGSNRSVLRVGAML
ncbi:uncharacterized protein AMSG_00619 [Thecamonas trahens ATCC 50062]|uniref:Uncharacterized protein n=1 Tax=Thecamonas trahens ATCC 50062 TaxID=461836 RepID=A0A0L0DGJ5_THETB|nr:hypothetical protein AMSG_00619 [Thecamonas trahens ATCC 50062]KNC50458.1 hypothetical protein AMSG_00619 [Thecamonas trahens ATCC 50062]|eukprot:XP_013762354.1 hypothetical protein AMSG_00619 [Thecamonas trahens ATCC 50062]